MINWYVVRILVSLMILNKHSRSFMRPCHMLLVQDGSKSVSPFPYRDSFSNPLSKHTIPITVTPPLNPFLGGIPVQS